MIIPAAMFVEYAVDMLKSGHLSQEDLDKQRKELTVAVPNITTDFQNGYELGMQTARVMLLGLPSAVKAGITL